MSRRKRQTKQERKGRHLDCICVCPFAGLPFSVKDEVMFF
jgi:hypothetical protein